MVPSGDFNAHGHKGIVRKFLFNVTQRRFANDRVGFHDVKFFRRQFSRFEQNRVGDAHLANVVERTGLINVLHKPRINRLAMTIVVLQRFRYDSAYPAYTLHVGARVVVP